MVIHIEKTQGKKTKDYYSDKDSGNDNTLTNTMNPILFNMVQCEKRGNKNGSIEWGNKTNDKF